MFHILYSVYLATGISELQPDMLCYHMECNILMYLILYAHIIKLILISSLH